MLSGRARQAFHEYFPIGRTVERQGRVYRQISYGPSLDVFMLDMRTFRGPNNTDTATTPPDTTFLGAEQVRWLVEGPAPVAGDVEGRRRRHADRPRRA